MLNGIHIAATGSGALQVTATNGHTLFRQTVEVPEVIEGMPEYILEFPKEALSALKKKANLDSEVSLALGDGSVTMNFKGIQYTLKVIELQYLDATRVIESAMTPCDSPYDDQHTFQPVYMAQMAKVAELVSPGRCPGMNFIPRGADAARVEFPRAPEAIGIIMPMRLR
jgi:hypothetical protein